MEVRLEKTSLPISATVLKHISEQCLTVSAVVFTLVVLLLKSIYDET